MPDSLRPYEVMLSDAIVKRIMSQANGSQHKVDALVIRLGEVMDRFRHSFGTLPATGDYIELREEGGYAVLSRSFIVPSESEPERLVLQIRDAQA